MSCDIDLMVPFPFYSFDELKFKVVSSCFCELHSHKKLFPHLACCLSRGQSSKSQGCKIFGLMLGEWILLGGERWKMRISFL